MAVQDEYTWIFVIGVIVCFISAFGIGANDLANSFGTTVGSKALTIGQCVVIAAAAEFAGASLLGASVTSTIRSGVVRLSKFQQTPDLLLYGFMCVLIATAFWDNFACHLRLPVSTTHTVVGATIGMALVLRGGGAVIWSADKVGFPYISGVLPVLLSWVCSPLVAGGIAFILFFVIRTFILRSNNSLMRTVFAMPVLVGGTCWMVTSFVIETGVKTKAWRDRGGSFAIWVGAVCGVGIGLLFAVIGMPLLLRAVRKDSAANERTKAIKADQEAGVETKVEEEPEKKSWMDKIGDKIPGWFKNNIIIRTITYGSRYNVHNEADMDAKVEAVYENAEVFDWETERLFRYLQIFSAISMAFAHGSNDVANALGPFSAIYYIWQTGTVPSNVPVEQWILFLGGAGIALGLATYGYKIIQVLGVHAVKLTNARGFAAEMATAITVILASRYGLPVSTTQTVTGAILAIGLFEGTKGVNWRLIIRIFFGWVLTLVVGGTVAGVLTAFGAYAPQKQAEDSVVSTAATLNITNNAMLSQLYAGQAALGAAGNDATLGAINTLNSSFYEAFSPAQKSLYQLITATVGTLDQFNTSLAYNPYTQVLPPFASGA